MKDLLDIMAKTANDALASYYDKEHIHNLVPWSQASDQQKESARKSARFWLNNPDATAAYAHDLWVDKKVKAGWAAGTKIDIELKTLPCLVPYEELPRQKQVGCELFRNIALTCVRKYSGTNRR